MTKVDFATINAKADLMGLAGAGLKRTASSGGGEWAGPCPLCGGHDRFHVQPNHQPAPRWLCRKCSGGQWRSAVDFVMRRDGVGLSEAARRLAPGGSGLAGHTDQAGRSGWAGGTSPGGDFGPPKDAGSPPSPEAETLEKTRKTWQQAGLDGVERTIRGLWNSQAGEAALGWLEGRGLEEATLRYFMVGWSEGQRDGPVYLPQGVTLPCLEGDALWYIKIALVPGQRVRCSGCGQEALARQACPRCGGMNKYRGVKGNRGGALYNCAELEFGHDRLALFVEGEFDCMCAWQRLRDQAAVLTLGSAGGRIDPGYWGGRLLRARRIFTLYDNDAAGEAGRKGVSELCGGASVDLYLPEGVNDINDFLLGGGRLEEVIDAQSKPAPITG